MNTLSVGRFVEGVAKARQRRRPSARNLRIYEAVRVQGEVQAIAAVHYKVTQGRVAQICQQVDRWRAQNEPAELNELGGEEKRKADLWLARQRLEAIYARAMQLLSKSQWSLITEKHGERNGKKWHERTERTTHGGVQWLKVALRVVEKLEKLSADPQPAADDPERNREREQVSQAAAAFQLLLGVRQEAERAGLAAADEDAPAVVERLLMELVGAKPQSGGTEVQEAIETTTPSERETRGERETQCERETGCERLNSNITNNACESEAVSNSEVASEPTAGSADCVAVCDDDSPPESPSEEPFFEPQENAADSNNPRSGLAQASSVISPSAASGHQAPHGSESQSAGKTVAGKTVAGKTGAGKTGAGKTGAGNKLAGRGVEGGCRESRCEEVGASHV